MKIYRWYSEKLHMGGITAHEINTTREEVFNEVYNYIVNYFMAIYIRRKKSCQSKPEQERNIQLHS